VVSTAPAEQDRGADAFEMRRSVKTIGLLFGLLGLSWVSSSAPYAQSPRFPGNKEARPYTRDLQPIDKVELLKLKKAGDLWNGEIASTETVDGIEAQKIATLWRTQTYRPFSSICHFPAYALKFYANDRLIVYATLCWDCDNIGFETPHLNATQGFGGKDKKGQALLNVFRAAFPEKK